MTSATSQIKQNLNDVGYYIPIASMVGKVYALNGTTLSTAAWASISPAASSISTAGAGLLKDMGKTYLSSARVFRKVQLVRTGAAFVSTFGVGGQVGTAAGEDYLTGYIEMGFEGGGQPAPVAHFGR